MNTSVSAPRRVAVSLGLFITAGATLSACGSGGSGSPSSSPSTTATTAAAAATTTAAATTGTSLAVVETEFHLKLSSASLKPGAYSIHVKNAGSFTHALTVNGPGVNDKSTASLAPGASATLVVTLKAGSYDIFCPVGNHKAMGMDEHVTVS
jgi:uncharacterized cupredoxin-like copper-binding protein